MKSLGGMNTLSLSK